MTDRRKNKVRALIVILNIKKIEDQRIRYKLKQTKFKFGVRADLGIGHKIRTLKRMPPLKSNLLLPSTESLP